MAGQSKTEAQVRGLIENIILSMNLDLLDVEYIKEDSEWILRIIIDKPGGISLDDCSDVSLSIDPVLDGADIIRNPYSLEVSSPGIDRPFTSDRDYERNIGQLVEVHPVRTGGGKQWYEGILKFIEEDRIGIVLDEPFVKGVKPRTNGQEKVFMRQDIQLVRKAVRF